MHEPAIFGWLNMLVCENVKGVGGTDWNSIPAINNIII
jgi:hypothetical protein